MSERMRVCRVPADGDCLFSSVAHAYMKKNRVTSRNLKRHARNLRKMALDYICPDGHLNRAAMVDDMPLHLLIEPDESEDVHAYCERMRNSGEWGSLVEIIAMTRVLECNIRVHTRFGIENYGQGYDHTLDILLEDHHYSALEPCRRSDILVGMLVVFSVWLFLSAST